MEGKNGASSRNVPRLSTSHLFRFDAIPGKLLNFAEKRFEDKASKYMEEIDYTCLGGVWDLILY